MALVILHPQLGKIVVPGVLKALAIRPARPPRSVTVPWLRIQGRDPGRPPVLDDEPERDFALDNAGRLVEIAPRGPWPRMRGLVIGWVPALLIEEQWIPVLVIGAEPEGGQVLSRVRESSYQAEVCGCIPPDLIHGAANDRR
jgi:hypothetical protein